jgi:Flp pilus assembly protein TadG
MTSPVLAPRSRRHRQCGVTLVEFAIVAPLLLVMLTGCVLVGIVAMNQMQLSNAVRDGARAAAVCGGIGRDSSVRLPDGTQCDQSHLLAYITANLNAVPGTVGLSVTVINGNSIPNDPNVLDECQKGKTVVVNASFPQPLYVPIVGSLIGDSGNTSVRTLTAKAEATCEE